MEGSNQVSKLRIQEFHKSYGKDFTLEIPKLVIGEGIHVILGANGSGKSTLLRAIAGIHSFQGSIALGTTSLKDQPIDFRRLIGFAEAQPSFPNFLSLPDLISVVLKAKPMAESELNNLKRSLNIGDWQNQAIGSFSSGMLKKSAILLAFMGDPKLIILDEPFTTLDVATQNSLTELIKSKSAMGHQFLMTSHQDQPLENLEITSTIKLAAGKMIEHEPA